MCMSVLQVCMPVYLVPPRGQKRMLKLELWTAVTYTALRCYVSAGKSI